MPEENIPIPTRRPELRALRVAPENYKTAYGFAGRIYKKFGPVVLSVVLFGSVAKGTAKKEADIDIVIVIDNVSMVWDQEVISWYREELFNLVKKEPARDKLHVNTITLSAFWDNVQVGDPAIINMLRYGVALVDLGFFEPLKFLLYQGRIKPTAESIFTVMNRTPWHLLRARIKSLSAVEDLYWAMVNASHAALMTAGLTPPSPEHVGDMLTEEFVKTKRISRVYVDWYEEMYQLAHDIKNAKINQISGKDYDIQLRRTQEFTSMMLKLTREREKEFLKKKGIKYF